MSILKVSYGSRNKLVISKDESRVEIDERLPEKYELGILETSELVLEKIIPYFMTTLRGSFQILEGEISIIMYATFKGLKRAVCYFDKDKFERLKWFNDYLDKEI